MPLTFEPELPPLRMDESGTIRVGKTRVLFVLLVREYQSGLTAEQIAAAYDSLSLADVHSAIGYYLRHKAEVEAHIAEYDRDAEEIRKKWEALKGSQDGMRDRLLKRIAEKRAKANGVAQDSSPYQSQDSQETIQRA